MVKIDHAKALAHCLAKRAVKEQWKRERIKLPHFDPWELTQAAEAYLAEHPELLEKAKLRLCST